LGVRRFLVLRLVGGVILLVVALFLVHKEADRQINTW
jgi:hypothetical protein